MPEGAKYVGRPGPFGNVFVPGQTYRIEAGIPVPATRSLLGYPIESKAHAVLLFSWWLSGQADLIKRASAELGGHDLACWCAEDQPCHADVWLVTLNG